ncbi:MAG: DNA repair protein RecO [Limisphaerales bacterium]
MEERAMGIILRTRPLTETSLIVQWLTRDLGRVATVAKGARRPKSPFMGKLDLFYAANFSFQRSRRSELHNLREVQLTNSNAKLREELGWIHQASYFAVLIERSTEAETPIPEIFELFASALAALTMGRPQARLIYAFELKLLGLLGYEPELDRLSAEAGGVAGKLLEANLDRSGGVVITARADTEMNRFLQTSIGSALERMPPQRLAALEAATSRTTGFS